MELADRHRGHASRALLPFPSGWYAPPVATILLVGVDLFFRGKLDVLLGESHRLTTTESIDQPDLVICDLARIEAGEVADTYPDVPILGYTNHTDTAGLRAAQAAGLDKVVVRSALAERAPQLVDELVA
jgi:DNA-binding NarL/FixJ family response regulator